jgi:hypothetical protein
MTNNRIRVSDWLCVYVMPLQRCFHWNMQLSSTYTTGCAIWRKQNGKRKLTSQSSTHPVTQTVGRRGAQYHSNSATIGAQFHHARLQYKISIFRIMNINITEIVYISKALTATAHARSMNAKAHTPKKADKSSCKRKVVVKAART